MAGMDPAGGFDMLGTILVLAGVTGFVLSLVAGVIKLIIAGSVILGSALLSCLVVALGGLIILWTNL